MNPRLFRVISDCESELASGAIIIVKVMDIAYADYRFDGEGFAEREWTRGANDLSVQSGGSHPRRPLKAFL